MTDRYERLFRRLAGIGRPAFIPFLVLGDPDPALSAQLVDVVIEAGADALELGIPFSDPVADGPVIQAAATRALRAGTTPARCWEMIAAIRSRAADLPIGLLVYANLIVRPGLDAFYRAAAGAGVDSVLVADVPAVESEPFRTAANRHGIASVQIAPPDASPERLAGVAAASQGYTYVTSRRGVTGGGGLGEGLATTIERLRALAAPPPVVGFGISEPEHLVAVSRAGATGAIAGSALVARIEAARKAGTDPVGAARDYVRMMRASADV